MWRSVVALLASGSLGCGPDEPHSSGTEGMTGPSSSTVTDATTEADTSGTTAGVTFDEPDLIFMSEEYGSPQLSSLNLATDEVNVYPQFTGESLYAIAVSPCGMSIAVALVDNIDWVRTDASSRSTLAEDPGFWAYALEWSPDGEMLAAEAIPKNAPESVDRILLIDAVDGSATTLEMFGLNTSLGELAWSPAGDAIVYSFEEDGQYDIAVRPIAANEAVLVDPTPANERYPAWSPDGERIAFGSDRDGDCVIYIHDLESAVSAPQTDAWSGDCRPHTDWSPTGDRIAYFHNETREVRVFTPDVGDESTIAVATFPSSDLRFSPSGGLLSYQEASDPSSVLFIVDVEGGSSTYLGVGRSARWRPTSSY